MPYKPDGTWEPEDDSVQGKVASITSQNSPLMQQARTRGLQQANSRGLLNSSIAIGAAENEAYKVALPIASQESGQVSQKNLSAQSASYADIAQEKDIAAKTALLTQDYTGKQGLLNSELSSKERIAALDAGSKESIARLNIGANDREKATNALAVMEKTYADMLNGIVGNANLTPDARNKYTTHIGQLRDSSLRLVEQMYGINLTWESAAGVNA